MSDKKEYDVSELAAYDSDEDVAVAEAGNKDGDVKKYAQQNREWTYAYIFAK